MSSLFFLRYKLYLFLGCVCFLHFSVSAQEYDVYRSLKRVIKSADSVEIFYTTDKKLRNTKSQLFYYSFYQGQVHSQQGIIFGSMLNGDYKLFYKSKLLEAGEYKNGLKSGDWKLWYPNGSIKEKKKWTNGLLNGMVSSYGNEGVVIDEIKYKRGKLIETKQKNKSDDEKKKNRFKQVKKNRKTKKIKKVEEKESKLKLKSMFWWKKPDSKQSEKP